MKFEKEKFVESLNQNFPGKDFKLTNFNSFGFGWSDTCKIEWSDEGEKHTLYIGVLYLKESFRMRIGPDYAKDRDALEEMIASIVGGTGVRQFVKCISKCLYSDSNEAGITYGFDTHHDRGFKSFLLSDFLPKVPEFATPVRRLTDSPEPGPGFTSESKPAELEG